MKYLSVMVKSTATIIAACMLMIPQVFAQGPGTTSTSGTDDIAKVPLFIGTNAKPNVIMGIDDSGSMDGEVLFFSNDGALWYNEINDNFEGSENSNGTAVDGTINFNTNGSANDDWKKYVYLFPNGRSTSVTDDRVYNDGTYDHYAIAPLINYAFARSTYYNKMYYDPTVTYVPWKDADSASYTFANASTTAAQADPVTGSITFDLTSDVVKTASNWTFRFFDGMYVPASTPIGSSCSTTVYASDTKITTATYVDLAICYYPSTYYQVVYGGTYSVDSGTTTYNCPTTSTGGTASHYNTFNTAPSSFVGTGGTDAVTGVTIADVHALAPDGLCLEKVEIKSANAPFVHTKTSAGLTNRTDCADPTSCTYAEEIQNFANWFQYYRKRHLSLRGAAGDAFTGKSGMYADYMKINSISKAVAMNDFDVTTERKTFIDELYAINGNGGGTPNRQALHAIGQQYERTNSGAPVIAECQKNYTLFFTDGFSTTSTSSGVGNADGNDGSPYADSYSNSFADIARYYYENDIRSDLTTGSGKVPVPPECKLTPLDPELDCNTKPHMQTFTLTLNAQGRIFGQSTSTSPLGTAMCGNTSFTGTVSTVSDAFACDPQWEDPNSARDLTQIDDLYHAAVNSRGDMFNASSGADLSKQLSAALNAITAQAGNSASSVAINTNTIATNTAVYVARYDTQRWHGDVIAYPIVSSGGALTVNLAAPLWNAANQMPAPASRTILSFDGTKGVAFNDVSGSITHLSSTMQSDLGTGLSTTDCNLGATPTTACTTLQRLDYIRGDTSKEDKVAFRVRTTKGGSPLGDIIHSSIVYVGKPSSIWPDVAPFPSSTGTTYREFLDNTTYLNRTPMVYAAGNDGMFHGFEAATGKELIAYVPNIIADTSASKGLHWLSDTAYTHTAYVDSTPSFQDAYVYTRTSGGGVSSSRSWRTVMVGGLRGGGQGYYALDLTDPTQFSESNADQTVLWEFSTSNTSYVPSGGGSAVTDNDIGMSFSVPTIVMTNVKDSGGTNNRWAAIFGNGYNSVNCNAVLYIAFMDGSMSDGTWDGADSGYSAINYSTADYVKIDTKNTQTSACNGLSEPALADLDGDGVVDRAYAGDMHGYMWAFDLCNRGAKACDTSGGWKVAHKTGSSPAALFIAKDSNGISQPISTLPGLSFHPTESTTSTTSPNVLVAFGTGKYIENEDKNPSTDINSFYTVWDKSDKGLLRAKLLQKTLTVSDDTLYRKTDISSVDWKTEYGWYVDLEAKTSTYAEERVIFAPAILGNIVFFNTAIPDSQLCSNGGTGWIMFLDLESGSPSSAPVVDIDKNGIVDSNDVAKFSGKNENIGGMKEGTFGTGGGIPTAPLPIDDKLVNTKMGTDDIDVRQTTLGFQKYEKRLNWRELRQ